MSTQLVGKVAVVTGGGSGIGRAIAEAYVAAGAKVIVADISGEEKTTADALGACAQPHHLDVTNGSEVQEMLDHAMSAFGALHILCNNAGIGGEVGPTGECTEENFDAVLKVNLRGTFLGMRYAIPLMVQGGGGSIVNMSSAAGVVGFPQVPAYAASKGGVVQLTRTAACEYGAAGVRVNAICPAAVDTPLTDRIGPDLIQPAISLTPLARIAQPSEIAAVATFLASDDASFVTGSIVGADGGYTAH